MTTLVGAPDRVDGLELIGEMVGSGYRTPPALVRRGDGQVMQLTPLLYAVLSATDGRRPYPEIAEVVAARIGRAVTESDVRTLVERQLRPLGLVRQADGSEPELRRSNPLLGLRFRVAATNPEATRRLTDPFCVLFHTAIVVAVLIGFVAVVGWVFFDRGLGRSAYDAFERPHLLLLVFVVSVLSGGFHEFGHAAAARYSGAQPGVMGAGLYLVWPAFYTDVTDSYRLGRAGRIRTDLGGLYFNAIVVVLTFVWWWTTGWEALLLLVATQVLQMAQQLLPLLRFDGYHLLADIAGVPDLYQRMRPTLLGLLPHRWRSPENRVLKPWSRAVITFWVLVTIPMMTLMVLGLILMVPRLLGSAGAAVRGDAAAVRDALGDGSGLDTAAHTLQLLGVVLPVLGCALILGRLGFRFFRGLATWSRGSVAKRGAAAAVGATVITVLSVAWWPQPGNYRPIGPDERGLISAFFQDSAPTSAAASAAGDGLVAMGAAARHRMSGDEPLVAVFDKADELPSEADPALAMVLVPTEESTRAPGSWDGTWVFPFDKPLPPAEGDNQALAVNTTDGSVTYDVAFALVWAEGDEVLNVNEAHAYASCSDCVAVAVAFQVVLIMDDARVVVPQNLAVAANYECYRCITAAIANQLVLSVPGEPGEEQLLALGEVWGQLLQLASTITSFTLAEVAAQLETFKEQIVTILYDAPVVESTASTASSSPSPTDSPGSEATTEPGPSSPAPAEETAPASPAPTPESTAPSPEPTPAETAAPEPSPSPETVTSGSDTTAP